MIGKAQLEQSGAAAVVKSRGRLNRCRFRRCRLRRCRLLNRSRFARSLTLPRRSCRLGRAVAPPCRSCRLGRDGRRARTPGRSGSTSSLIRSDEQGSRIRGAGIGPADRRYRQEQENSEQDGAEEQN
jgi:hypothetical protein